VSITLTQLRSFLAVMRTGSVTGAADELVVTQPSVSAAVTALSREVGTALLEREGRGVRPTAAGAAFAPFATDVIGLLERGTSTALEAAALSARELNIAAVTTAAESFVPALIRSFSEAHPGVGLTLSVGNREGVFAMVADHTADVAFVGRPPRDERIESWPVRVNELVLIGAPDDPFVAAAPMLAPVGATAYVQPPVAASLKLATVKALLLWTRVLSDVELVPSGSEVMP